MQIEEFIETNPNTYGDSNINLFYSSSVSASVPLPPFTIKGLTIQTNTADGINIDSALKGVETFRFDFGGKQVEAIVNGRIKRPGYLYFSLKPTVTNTLPTSVDPIGNTVEDDSEFIFIPYNQTSFNNNDYNPLMNNSEGSKVNVIAQVVDRTSDAIIPTNLDAILSGTAEPAELQNCSYTKRSIISSRYLGSKLSSAGSAYNLNKEKLSQFVTSNTISGSYSAQAYKSFEGSTHADDADTATIKNISTSDREVKQIYFDSIISGSHPNKVYPGFPGVSNYIYFLEDASLIRIPTRKIYSVETNEIFTTDEFGKVTSVD